MEADEVNRIAVVGFGLMGHGIALEFAMAGYDVRVHSRSDAGLERGMRRVEDTIGRLEALGRARAGDGRQALRKLQPTTGLAHAVESADVVVESVYEDLELKREVLAEIDRLAPQRTILASNSSTFVPSSLAPATARPDRVIGAHYINPPYLVPMVEVTPSAETSESTVQTLADLLRRIGKHPVVLRKEAPGFIASRLQGALLREAPWIVENGVASAQDVDEVIRSSIGRRWAVAGVFEVLDLAGWDLMHAVASSLFPHLASSPEVPNVLAERVKRGELGVKSGRGFNEWTPESAEALRHRIAQGLAKLDEWSSAG